MDERLKFIARLLDVSGTDPGVAGWGARIRTWEWRNQNPLPYHLATPQIADARTAPGITAGVAGINAVGASGCSLHSLQRSQMWNARPGFRRSSIRATLSRSFSPPRFP
jgi:hypothetical protein